jgi:hypothetical protein
MSVFEDTAFLGRYLRIKSITDAYGNFAGRFRAGKRSSYLTQNSIATFLSTLSCRDMVYEFLGDALRIRKPSIDINEANTADMTTAFAVWFRGATKGIPVVNRCEPFVDKVGHSTVRRVGMTSEHCDVRTLLQVVLGSLFVGELHDDPEQRLALFVQHVAAAIDIDAAILKNRDAAREEQLLCDLSTRTSAARMAAIALFERLWMMIKRKFVTQGDIRRGLGKCTVFPAHAENFNLGRQALLVRRAGDQTQPAPTE